MISILFLWKWTHYIDVPSDEWCATLVHPVQFFLGRCRCFVLSVDRAMLDAIGYIHMHAWPPIGTMEGIKQLFLPEVPQGVVCVHQQLCPGHEWWCVHPILRQGGHGWEKDLQFFAACPIHSPQLPNLVGLIHILKQPAHPEVINQRPVPSHIGCSPHGYCALTGLTKPWLVMQMPAARLSSTVFVVAMVAPVTKYYRGQIIGVPAPHTWLVVHWRQGPSKQGSFTPSKGLLQIKGTTDDQIGHACGLIFWTR